MDLRQPSTRETYRQQEDDPMPPFGVVLGKELREERGDWHLARLLLYLALWQIPPSTRSTGESEEGGDELGNRPGPSRHRTFPEAGSSPSALCLAAGGNCGLKAYPIFAAPDPEQT